jgi:regulator of replication initiation timing
MNYLIERSSKTSPEDWRRLQQEREGLVRQLSGEKEAHQKTVEENRGLRQEKLRLEEQVRNYITILYLAGKKFLHVGMYSYQLLGSHTWLLLL